MDEYPNSRILEFISGIIYFLSRTVYGKLVSLGGSKQYGIRIQNDDGSIEEKIRLRGITLNWKTYKIMSGTENKTTAFSDKELSSLAYEAFKKKVLEWASINDHENDDKNQEDNHFIFDYAQIRPQRTGGVLTKNISKIYRPILPKGVICNNFNVRHFGFKGN